MPRHDGTTCYQACAQVFHNIYIYTVYEVELSIYVLYNTPPPYSCDTSLSRYKCETLPVQTIDITTPMGDTQGGPLLQTDCPARTRGGCPFPSTFQDLPLMLCVHLEGRLLTKAPPSRDVADCQDLPETDSTEQSGLTCREDAVIGIIEMKQIKGRTWCKRERGLLCFR